MKTKIKLSILDQSPISIGMEPADALQATIDLAKHGEMLGYERFWVAEHHDLFGLASSNPAVLLSAIGARTSKIRLGAGAVLLPYYKPFHVAETYNLLATLYPDRIDLGLGRAPGGSAEVSLALSNNYLAGVREFPGKIDELTYFLRGNFPGNHQFANLTPTPLPSVSPDLWLLGTSEKSGALAATKGMKYAFGHFMTDRNGPGILANYREKMKKHHPEKEAEVIVAINVICAETTKKAEELAMSQFLWKVRQHMEDADHRVPTITTAKDYPYTKEELKKLAEYKKQTIIGDPHEVRDQLLKLDKKYKADEYMIVTIVHNPEDKRRSYTLLKEAIK